MIKVIDTLEGFEALHEEWARLAQSSAMQIFQTYEWNYWSWVKLLSQESGNRLCILQWTGTKGESPIIMPCYLDACSSLRFINDMHSDCCNAVYVPGDNKYNSFSDIVEHIQEDKAIKSVKLQKLHADSEVLHYLGVLWKDAVVYRDNTYSWIDYKAGSEGLKGILPHLSSREMSCPKAMLRKTDGHFFKVISKANGVAFPKGQILEIRESLLTNTAREAAFMPDGLLEMIEQIYNAGLCEIAEIEKGGKIESLTFQLVKGNYSIGWIFMYRDPQLNSGLYLQYVLAKASGTEDGVMDFGVGTYPYKMRTFRPRTACTFGLRWGRGWVRVVRGFKEMNWRLLKDCLKIRMKKGE